MVVFDFLRFDVAFLYFLFDARPRLVFSVYSNDCVVNLRLVSPHKATSPYRRSISDRFTQYSANSPYGCFYLRLVFSIQFDVDLWMFFCFCLQLVLSIQRDVARWLSFVYGWRPRYSAMSNSGRFLLARFRTPDGFAIQLLAGF